MDGGVCVPSPSPPASPASGCRYSFGHDRHLRSPSPYAAIRPIALSTLPTQSQIAALYYQQPQSEQFPRPPLSDALAPGPGANSWQHPSSASPSSAPPHPRILDSYICQVCNKAFSRPSSLRIHSFSHTAEKPFKCHHAGCGKAFIVRSNLKRHERACRNLQLAGECETPRNLNPESGLTEHSSSSAPHRLLPHHEGFGETKEASRTFQQRENLDIRSPNSSVPVLICDPSSQESEDDGDSGHWMSDRKADMIDRIMAWFKAWLESKLASSVYAHKGHSDEGEGQKEHLKQDGSQKPPSDTNCSKKRSIGERDDKGSISDSEGEGGDDRNSGGRGRNKRPRHEPTGSRKLACPFFKRNRAKYQIWRTCPGPGWVTVHRVKEHLFRRHALPKFRCNRCCEDFNDAPTLRNHNRTVFCNVKDDLQEGIDGAQERSLRSRKNCAGRTECQKWVEMYAIVFPDDDVVPTPYYDDEPSSQQEQSLIVLDEYGEFLRRELPPLVRRNLESILDFELQETLQDRIVQMVQNIHLELSGVFQKSRAPQHQRLGQEPTMDTSGLELPVGPEADDSMTQLNLPNPFLNFDDRFFDDVGFSDLDFLAELVPKDGTSDSGYISLDKIDYQSNEGG